MAITENLKVVGIESGGFTVIDSGMFLMAESEGSNCILFDDVRIEFVFLSSDSDEEGLIDIENVSNKHMKFFCKNWGGGRGRGFSKPLPLIVEEGTNIYLRFMVSNLSSLPAFFYSFYIKDNTDGEAAFVSEDI